MEKENWMSGVNVLADGYDPKAIPADGDASNPNKEGFTIPSPSCMMMSRPPARAKARESKPKAE